MMQRYESYKPSGVKWIGDIPAHWNIQPGFTCFKENKDRNKGLVESTVLSLSYGRIIVKPEEKLTGLVPESFETYQLIKPGDIVIRTTDLQNDQTSLRVGYAKDKGMITSAYLGLRCHPEINSEYVFRLFESYDALKVFYGMGSGLRQNIDFCDFKRLPVPLPPRDEQDRIVAFLDQKTAEINAAIAKKEQLIGLLKEQKSILVNQAVTKGLNPNVPQRDSGVEWVGEIPEHWELRPLKRLVHFVGGGTPNKNNPAFWDGEIPWISPKDMKFEAVTQSQDHITELAVRKSSVKLIPIGSVLVVVRGMILAKTFPVGVTQLSVTINQDMKGLIPKKGIDPEFLRYVLSGQEQHVLDLTEESGHGTKTMPTDKLGSFPIIVPPLDEQICIRSYCMKVSEDIKRSIDSIRKQVTQLQEFKATVVASIVTGRIKF